MKLFNLIKNFRNDEDGAVTVDWVVLTAAIVGLGIVVMNTVGSGINDAASTLTTKLGTSVTNAGATDSTTYGTSTGTGTGG